jgi:hypothetical protein
MPSISDLRPVGAEGILPQLDPMGWASLAAGLPVALIIFFTSYSHVDLFGNQPSNCGSKSSSTRGKSKKRTNLIENDI